ncbi:MAG: hypothetical protein ACQEXV_07415 [Bacillota bacterium]
MDMWKLYPNTADNLTLREAVLSGPNDGQNWDWRGVLKTGIGQFQRYGGK